MDTRRRVIKRLMLTRPSQTKVRAHRRLEDIATKGLHDPGAPSRVEILEMCKLVYCRLSETAEGLEMRRRSEAIAEMVRLSQELALE